MAQSSERCGHAKSSAKKNDEWWKRADAAFSEFPAYRALAGREIPVLVMEPSTLS
jgi:hypothetical protein